MDRFSRKNGTVKQMADELIRLDKTIIGIDRLIAKASTAEEAKVLFTVKDVIYSQQKYAIDVQPVNQWISVDDKLPDTVYDCLVWYSCDTAFGKSKSVGISFCSRCDWYKKHLNGDNIVVLYWMPLPEPPKDGDTE